MDVARFAQPPHVVDSDCTVFNLERLLEVWQLGRLQPEFSTGRSEGHPGLQRIGGCRAGLGAPNHPRYSFVGLIDPKGVVATLLSFTF